MSLDRKTVERIAHLARLKVPEEKLDPLASELSTILTFVEQLNEVDTDGVEPMTSAVEMSLYQREDQVTDGGYREKVLQNAPNAAEGFFVVPKVVE